MRGDIMFKKQPNPTFSARVEIVDPDSDAPGILHVTFRRKKRKEFNALMASVHDGRTEAQAIDELVAGWDETAEDSMVTVPYGAAALESLLDTFWGAGAALTQAYVRAQSEARAKN